MTMKNAQAIIAVTDTTDPNELAMWVQAAQSWGLSYIVEQSGRVSTFTVMCAVEYRNTDNDPLPLATPDTIH